MKIKIIAEVKGVPVDFTLDAGSEVAVITVETAEKLK